MNRTASPERENGCDRRSDKEDDPKVGMSGGRSRRRKRRSSLSRLIEHDQYPKKASESVLSS